MPHLLLEPRVMVLGAALRQVLSLTLDICNCRSGRADFESYAGPADFAAEDPKSCQTLTEISERAYMIL